jgi:hypothetical protein
MVPKGAPMDNLTGLRSFGRFQEVVERLGHVGRQVGIDLAGSQDQVRAIGVDHAADVCHVDTLFDADGIKGSFKAGKLRIVGHSLDALFERVFADRSKEERAAIKKKYATESAIAEAAKRIEAICLDLIEHYTTHLQPNGYKAQVVACSRDAVALYKEAHDRLNAPASAIIISGSNENEAHLAKHHTEKDERKRLIQDFLKPGHPRGRTTTTPRRRG